jgi:predicted Zn-dependent peptidase
MKGHSIETSKTAAGIPVAVEHIPGCRSYGCMIGVATGSRDESKDILGLSHLLEHTVFRRTSKRDSYQMAVEMEGAGGEMNAFTGREMTAFYAVTIKETAGVARDMIGEIVADPLIAEEDTELEKKIVLQELSMIKNEPESYIHDLFSMELWRGHPLCQDEGGDEKLVAGMTSRDLRAYYDERYLIPNLCVYAAGDADLDETVEWAESALDGMTGGRRNARSAPPTPESGYRFVENKADHYQVAMGFPAPGASSPDRTAVKMLSAVLGSGTSSRLFQNVREKKALVYSIYSTVSQHSDASSMAVYMSCTDENVVEAMTTTSSVIGGLLKEGLEKGELERAKRLVKGANIRAMESTESRLYRLGVNHMLSGDTETLEERLGKIDAVTEDDIMRAAELYLREDRLNTVVFGERNRKLKHFDAGSLSFRSHPSAQEHHPAVLGDLELPDRESGLLHQRYDIRIVAEPGAISLEGLLHVPLVTWIGLHLRSDDEQASLREDPVDLRYRGLEIRPEEVRLHGGHHIDGAVPVGQGIDRCAFRDQGALGDQVRVDL